MVMNLFDLMGKIVLVMGVSCGIGEEIVKLFVE